MVSTQRKRVNLSIKSQDEESVFFVWEDSRMMDRQSTSETQDGLIQQDLNLDLGV